jgi:hypothetical protein
LKAEMKRLLLIVVLLASGCSTEQAYHSVKGWQKNECNKQADNAAREQCLKETDTSYDEYKKQTATP